MSTITVYRGWLEPGRYVWSPFVTKVEARLRFSNIPYKTAAGNPKTAPKGKIPYIEITEGNEANPRTSIGDSTLIIKHLVESNTLPDLNGELAPELKANDLAIRALLEDKAYFYNTRERWTENYYTMRDHVLGAVPYPIRVILGMFIHRTMVQTLHGQGTGRYSADEIQEFRVEAWNAVNDLLVASKAKQTQHQGQVGDAGRPFWVLGGEEPTEADTTVFGFVISALICTAGPKARELVMGFPVMREYARRIHDEYFPDYELWDE